MATSKPLVIKNDSAWKWYKLTRDIRTKTPMQHHVLLVLVRYTNLAGTCFPSYERLMLDSRIKSKTTISKVLVYLRDTLKIIDWVPGHGNQYKHPHNTYRFNQNELIKILKKQKLDESIPCIEEPS